MSATKNSLGVIPIIVSKLPQLTHDRHLTLAELERISGLCVKSVVKLYYADVTSIHIETLDRLCRALGVTPGDLLEYIPGDAKARLAVSWLPDAISPKNKRARRVAVVGNGARGKKEGACERS